MNKNLLFFLLLLLAFNTAKAQNLLINGDFEGANNVGYNVNGNGYNQIFPPFAPSTSSGNFAIFNNPASVNSQSFLPGGDHPTGAAAGVGAGTGNMMIIDGNNTGGNQRFWRAGTSGTGVNNLLTGAKYEFSYWIKTISNNGNLPFIDLQISNSSNLLLAVGTKLAPNSDLGWREVKYQFKATNSTVYIELWNTITEFVGNDFAVDDFSLKLIPPSATITGTTPLCENFTAASPIIFTGNNGINNNYTFTYSINGGANQTITTNTGTATLDISTLINGVYTYTLNNVSSGTSPLMSQNLNQDFVLTVQLEPNSIATIEGNSNICLNDINQNITFTGAQGIAPYTFEYNINGGLTQTATSTGTIFSLPVNTAVPSSTVYNLLSVISSTDTCKKILTASKTVVVNDIPNITAAIQSNAQICKDDTQNVTFSGFQGTSPYTFEYNINGGATQTVTTTNGNSFSLPIDTSVVTTVTYNLLSVISNNSTCKKNLNVSKTITINDLPTGTISAGTTVCSTATAPTLITFTGAGGTSPYAFTYTINDGTTTSNSITVSTAANSNSVDVTFPTDYEGTYIYNLVSVSSGSAPFCEKTLNLSETFVVSPPPTAVFTSGNVEFTCPGSQATLLISGTPNATVFFNTSSDLGPPFLQVVLDNTGNGSYLTPAIFATTEFNLIRAENGSCASSLNSSVKITLSYANTSLTGGTAFIKVEGPDIICEKFDDTSPIPPINIAATFNTIKTTSSYTVQSIPYQPQFNFESPNTIPIPPTGQNQDDFWSGATNTTPYTLPFKFGFYGNNYEQLTVGSNGVLSFNLSYQTPGNICPYVFPNNLDATAPIKNAIFGVYQDIIFNPLATPTSSINYYIYPQLGCVQAKNRVFVMNTNKTFLYGDSSGASSGLQSYQIIMYETTNIIDVVVKRRKNATGWQNNLGIIGLINFDGSMSKAAPGRNRNDVWQSLTGEAWRFIPAGIAKYTLKWYKNGTFLSEELNPTILPNGQVQSNITVPPVDGDFYTAKLVIQPVTAGDPTYNLEDTYVVNINATKFKKPVDVTVCGTDTNGDIVFNINQNIYMANGANVGNFDFGYYNSLQDAKDLASPINYSAPLVLSPTTTTFPKTIYVNANDIATGCSTLLKFNLYGKKSPEGTFSYPDDGGEIGFCRSSNTALAPTPSVVFSPDGVYTVDPPIGLSINSNTGVLDLTDALPGNYTISYKIAATESCPEYSTTATVKINLCTDLQIPAVACEDSIFTLSTTNAGSGVTYTWSDANGVITNTYETPTVNILAPATSGSYSYTVVASIGTENSLPSSENLQVVNSPDATILTTTPGVCVGNPASIAITSSPGAIVKYTVDGGAPISITIEADGTNEITVNPATPQSVYQLVSAENPTSPSCTKTYTATSPNSNVTIITGEPAATISVSGTNPICINSTSVIRFTGNGGATVHYSKNGVGDFTALIDATTGFVDVTTDVLTTSTDYDLMSIVVSGTNPCIKNYPSGSAKVTVIVNPNPTITGFSTTTAFICTGTKGKLTFTGPSNTMIEYSDGSLPHYTVALNGPGPTTTIEIDTPNNLTVATNFSLVSITTNDALACKSTNFTLPPVLIQISNGPSITAQPQTTTVCEGASDAVLSITGIGASLSYQWNDGTNNVGTNSNTLNVPSTLVNNGKSYTCTVTDACGVFVNSAIATVNVTAKPVFTQQTQGTSPICAGNQINLTVIATGVGVTYKWFRGTTDLSTSNLSASTSNLVIQNAQSTDSGDYTCVATTCSSVTSGIKTVTVNPLPTVSTFSAANASICSGTKGNLIFSGTPNSTIVYSDGTTNSFTATTDAFGAANVFTTNYLTTPTTFTLVSIKDNLTSCINTTFTTILPVTIGINALPTVGNPTTATATLICSGDPATILSVVATGSGLTYVWKKDNSIVPNSNSNSITVPSIAANTGNYSCTVTDVCGQTVITTIPLSLVINDAPTISQATAGSTICSGTTINLSIVTTGIGLTYQWKKNGVDLPTTNPTATTNNLVIVNAQTTDAGDYTCEAKSGTCSVTSPIAAMIVNQAPQVITQPISNVYCSGDDITLSVGVSIPTVTYQWQFNGTDLTGETNFELHLTSVTIADSGEYVCLIDNLPCKQIKSKKAVILVKAAPFATIQTQTSSTTVCAGTDSNLIFNGTPNAKVTYTINNGANQFLSLSPSGIATIINTGILETTTTYQLVSISTNDFSPICIAPLTDLVTINVVAIPEPTLTEDGFICVDENNVTQRKFRMETGLSASQYNFQWYENNVAIAAPEGTTDFYDAEKATTYSVEITDIATGCKRSAMTKITSSLQPKTVTATVLSGYFDDNATIEITADPINGDFEYQLDNGPFQDSNIFSNVPSGDHNVYARDKRECNTTAAFSIKITNYPKFFTPNGDGINDYWNIFNLSNQINAKIYIFDRFGKFMKQISTTGQGWDGNFNTKPAAADDYWFVIKYEEQQINKEFKAHFTLKR